MKKILTYLKPFAIGVLLALALLFGQAMCDLNLPNYMSDIVNVGIQQNGIEHAAPNAISQDGMRLMTTFMLEDEKQIIENGYTLTATSKKDASGKLYSELYPNAGEQIYVMKKVDSATQGELDHVFGAAAMTFISVMQDMAEQSGQTTEDSSEDDKTIEPSEIYQMLPMLGMIPRETIEVAHEKAITEYELSLKQSGIAFSKAFYIELGFDVGALQTSYIVKIGLIMLLIAFLGGVATVLVGFLSSKIATGIARNLRRDLFEKVESFSNTEFDKFSTASLITRCTNDVTQIQMLFMMGIRMMCYAPIMGIGGIVMAVNKAASMTWIIVLAVIVLVCMIAVIMSIAVPRFQIIQKLIDKLNLVSRENLSGLMVIRAFGTREHETKRFDSANGELTKTNLFIQRVMSLMFPAMNLIMNGATLLIIWVSAHNIANATMQVGDMMAFMQYAMQIIFSFLMISMMFVNVPRAAVSAQRIADILNTDVSIIDPKNPKKLIKGQKGIVEFQNVNFRYQGAEEDTLSNISFTAVPGQTTAIIGPTGSGKSTIANMMMRFYDVTEGRILIDGVDVREVTQQDLREVIGYVPQKGVLLSGTISSNLKYGRKDTPDDEIESVAKVAQALDFIEDMPGGFESEISQGGTNVSGGQKQRLSITRALTKKPEFLIFDDSFSALDFKTDATLRKALKEHTQDCTVIVVAQRVSTIMSAEQIIVLDKGQIVGRGTHRELLKDCPEYYEIASSQLSKEELA